MPPISMRSAVEKNVRYVGYPAIDDTTHDASMTIARHPARSIAMAAARPHGPAPTMTTSVSESNDLISPRADADIGDPRLRQLLNAVQVAARLSWKIVETPSFRRRSTPALHPLIARTYSIQRHEVARKLREHLAVELIGRAEPNPVERVKHVELGHREPREAV